MANAESSLTPKSRAYQFAVANGFHISASCYNHRMTCRADHAAGSVEASSYGSLLTRMQTLHAQFKAFLHQERQVEKAHTLALSYSTGPGFAKRAKEASRLLAAPFDTFRREGEHIPGQFPTDNPKRPWRIIETINGERRIHWNTYASRAEALKTVRREFAGRPFIRIERRV